MTEQKEQEYTDLEKVLKLTVEKQSRRIGNLILDLDLAHSQIEIMKAGEEKVEEVKKDE